MRKHKLKRRPKIYIPTYTGFFYTLFAVILVPWVIYLANSLPTRHPEPHYDYAWVGLDIGLVIVLLLTGFFASIKSRWVIIFACITGSFLLVDAWFDMLSSRPGFELNEAIVLAVFLEIPLAIASFWVAFRVLNQNIVD